MTSRRSAPVSWPLLAGLLLMLAGAPAARAQDGAAALRERHAALREALRTSALQRPPAVIESVQAAGEITGRIHAVIDQPFARLAAMAPSAAQWCEALMLHLNNKQCQPLGSAGQQALALWVSRRYDLPLEKAQRIDFTIQPAAVGAGYVDVVLAAAKGPLGTHDYRIRVEAMPLGAAQTVVQMSYAYEFNVAARMAMQAYLAMGRPKIGFTITERRPDGSPVYVSSLRGLVERNTMRYFLALDAYLASLAQPAAQQLENRLRQWIAAVEHYAPQLHEADEVEYLEMKRRELAR